MTSLEGGLFRTGVYCPSSLNVGFCVGTKISPSRSEATVTHVYEIYLVAQLLGIRDGNWG